MTVENQASETVVENENASYLDMSDEEVANLDLNFLDESEEEESGDDLNEGEAEGEDQVTEDDDSDDDVEDLSDDENETSDEDDDEEDAEPDTDEEESEEETEDDESDESEEPEEETEQTSKVDFRFTANGKEMHITNEEDAIQLMQMGAGFNKHMASIKPHRKTLKLLEKNGLLDEEKLGFLIDLDKKNPEAITKLLKDSGIDPLDLDVKAESEYKPNSYTVDDREIDLDQVLDSIKDTPTYSQTIEVVSNKWDASSKQTVADNPQLLEVINDHMASGVYELINNEIESERMFGRLNGLSDLEAYRAIGDKIQARGGFDHLFNKQSQTPAAKTPSPKPKKKPDPKLKSKKRAAGSTKSAVTSKAEPDFNPLDLPDEEFSKLGIDKFL